MAIRTMFLVLSSLLVQTVAFAAPPLKSINSSMPEYGLVKGPDGYYFSRSTAAFGKPGKEQILKVPFDGGLDTSPEWTDRAYSEGDPYFSADGEQFCFASDRPDSADPHSGDTDIWCASRTDNGWSDPSRLPEPVNSPGVEFSPVLAADGSLYFASDRAGGFGQGDLYRATRMENEQWQVENLGPTVNSPQGEWNIEISPNGELLLFEASGRKSNLSISGDLYISRKTSSGWSEPVPLSKVNTTGSELMPRFISADELAYASSDEGDANIFVVKLDVITDELLHSADGIMDADDPELIPAEDFQQVPDA